MNPALFGSNEETAQQRQPGAPVAASPLAAITPASAHKAAGEMLYVKDSTATALYPLRTHEIWDVDHPVAYEFRANIYTAMPWAHGIKLLRIPEFIVRVGSAEGPLLQTQGDPDGRIAARDGITLSETDVVARYDELTDRALALRCNQVTGGERLRPGDGKLALIRFLVDSRKRAILEAETAKRRRPDHLAPLPGDVPEDEIAGDSEGHADSPQMAAFFKKIAQEAESVVG